MFVQMYFLTPGHNFIFDVLTEHRDDCSCEKVQVPHDSCPPRTLEEPKATFARGLAG